MFCIVKCTKAPEQHDMHLVIFSDGHECDKCNRKIAKSEQGLRCDICDYDLCHACAMPTASAPDAESDDKKQTGGTFAASTFSKPETNSQLKF